MFSWTWLQHLLTATFFYAAYCQSSTVGTGHIIRSHALSLGALYCKPTFPFKFCIINWNFWVWHFLNKEVRRSWKSIWKVTGQNDFGSERIGSAASNSRGMRRASKAGESFRHLPGFSHVVTTHGVFMFSTCSRATSQSSYQHCKRVKSY